MPSAIILVAGVVGLAADPAAVDANVAIDVIYAMLPINVTGLLPRNGALFEV